MMKIKLHVGEKLKGEYCSSENFQITVLTSKCNAASTIMFKFYIFNCILEASSEHVTFHALEASRIQRLELHLLVKTYCYAMYMYMAACIKVIIRLVSLECSISVANYK